MESSLYQQEITANQIGRFGVDLPRCQSVVLQVIETSSLAFTLQTSLYKDAKKTDVGWVNSLCQMPTGKRYLTGQSIVAASGDRLLLDGCAVQGLQLTVTAGTGKVLVRATDAILPCIAPATECFSFIPDATDELLIKSSFALVWGIEAYTIDATPVYIKLYNKATAPSEADTPAHRLLLPCNATAANGAGNNVSFATPLRFPTGLGVRAVTGLADNSDSALTDAENYVNIRYE